MQIGGGFFDKIDCSGFRRLFYGNGKVFLSTVNC